MSQTPIDNNPSRELLAYDQGWAALNLMLREGRSFSGRERNCSFLNLGKSSGRFANVSAASGLDLIDDGRGLAYADWDHDGDLDLWTSARTAPRVRFLRNNFPADAKKPRWIALRLRGTSSNRDGIGARVEVVLADGAKRVKSLAAGHGHLSQSTKWLYFGLGDAEGVGEAFVHWPGGKSERFDGLQRGRHQLLVQDSGKAERLPERERVALPKRAPLEIEQSGEGDRIVLLRPAPMPLLDVITLDGEPIDCNAAGKPILLNLWATWCAPCKAEMKDWADARREFGSVGLRVVSVSVDEPGDAPEERLEEIRKFVQDLGYPYEVGLPGADLPDVLDTVQRAFIGRQEDLPVPSSFLIDGRGRVVAIYRGSVSARQLAEDFSLLDADADTRLAAAIPFPGRWIEPPAPTDAGKIAGKFSLKGDLEAAARYVETALERNREDPGLLTNGEAAALHRVRGAALFDLKRYRPSLESWTALLAISPDDHDVRIEAARCHLALGEIDPAIAAYEKALSLRPSSPDLIYDLAKLYARKGNHGKAADLFESALTLASTPNAHFEHASSLVAMGRIADAIVALREALELRPGWPPAANNLAWILATCPDDGIRNAKEALKLATEACEKSNYRYPSALGTLAAAHAENGQFDKAVEFNDRAVEVAKEQNQAPARIDQIAAPRVNYVESEPFRDPALKIRSAKL